MSPRALKICFLLGLCLLVRWPSLGLFPDRDEGETATLAEQWLDHGKIPYRDYLEQKPPLAILVNMAAFKIFGRHMAAVRVTALAWQAGALLCFFFLLEGLAGQAAAFWGALLLVLAAASTGLQGLAAGTETWMLLPFVAAVAVLAGDRREPSSSRWFAAGIYLGLACLAKQSAGPALIVFPFAAAGGGRGRARAFLFLWLGAAIPAAATAAWFLSMGAAADLWACLVPYGFAYAGQGLRGFGARLGAALWHLSREQGALWLMALAGLVAARKEAATLRLASAWLVSAALGTAMSGRFYPHYFLPLAPPLAALGGYWLAGAGRGLADREFSPSARLARLICLVLFAAAWTGKAWPLWTAADGAEKMRRQYGVESMAQGSAAAEMLNRVDPSHGRLWIWGSEAELFFLSHREPATRFLFHYPFTGESAPWKGGEAEMTEALRDPAVTAVVMAAPLDPKDPFQARLVDELSLRFREAARGPGYLIAVRKETVHEPNR